MPITKEQLIGLCGEGHLYHVAQVGSWPSIQQHGLLSTSALLDRFGYEGERRKAIESEHRPDCVPLRSHRKDLFPATVRDQRPLNEAMLRRCLEGCTLEQFYKLLNERVFFWLSLSRVARMMNAYPECEHDLLIIDAERFIDAYVGRVELSHLNSGAARSVDHKRGPDLFKTIDNFPYDKSGKEGNKTVAELTIKGEVKNVSKFVRDVKRMRGQDWEIIWERETYNQ